MESQREKLIREIRSKIDLSFYEFQLERDIESLKSFIENGEQWIILEEKKLEKKLTTWNQEIHKYEDAPEPYDIYETEILNFDSYKFILYNSSFFTAYSIFENQLKNLCIELEEYNTSKIKLVDLKGDSYIATYRKYIEKIIEINLTDLNDIWEKINFYREIRNLIIHSDGNIGNRKTDFKNKIKKYPGINLNPQSNCITIESKDFIIDFIIIAEKYIIKIIDKLNNKYEK